MLPDDIVEFLHGPLFLALGTRSSKLRPAMARVVGAFADAATDRISFFLPNVQREPHLTNLADNGQVAFTAGEPRSHKITSSRVGLWRSGPAQPPMPRSPRCIATS